MQECAASGGPFIAGKVEKTKVLLLPAVQDRSCIHTGQKNLFPVRDLRGKRMTAGKTGTEQTGIPTRKTIPFVLR